VTFLLLISAHQQLRATDPKPLSLPPVLPRESNGRNLEPLQPPPCLPIAPWRPIDRLDITHLQLQTLWSWESSTLETEPRYHRSGATWCQLFVQRRVYQKMRSEAGSSEDDPAARAVARRKAIDREQNPRIAELRQRSSVRVEIKLVSVMLVEQPKLQIAAAATVKERCVRRLDLVWDPLSDGLEAVSCTRCGQPTFTLRIEQADLVCANCPAAPPRTVIHRR
jgi:hypothetical protein